LHLRFIAEDAFSDVKNGTAGCDGMCSLMQRCVVLPHCYSIYEQTDSGVGIVDAGKDVVPHFGMVPTAVIAEQRVDWDATKMLLNASDLLRVHPRLVPHDLDSDIALH